MLPVLRLAEHEEVKFSDAVEVLADEFALSDEERSQLLPSGKQTRFANRVHWAKSYLSKAGLVDQTRRAHYRANDQGRAVLNNPPDKIDIAFLGQFPGFEEFRTAGSGNGSGAGAEESITVSSDLTPDERMRSAHSEITNALADELIGRVRNGSPEFFERVVVRLLIAMGYGGTVDEIDEDLAVVGKSGDGGIDGVIDQDPLGLDRVYIQAKRYAADNSVGSHAIRDFYGSLAGHKATKGLFVTTSTFTASARQTAEGLPQKIVLVDGKQLSRLMIRHQVGCRVQETLQIKKIDEDFFED
jgi:restriction system protein